MLFCRLWLFCLLWPSGVGYRLGPRKAATHFPSLSTGQSNHRESSPFLCPLEASRGSDYYDRNLALFEVSGGAIQVRWTDGRLSGASPDRSAKRGCGSLGPSETLATLPPLPSPGPFTFAFLCPSPRQLILHTFFPPPCPGLFLALGSAVCCG